MMSLPDRYVKVFSGSKPEIEGSLQEWLDVVAEGRVVTQLSVTALEWTTGGDPAVLVVVQVSSLEEMS
jgi:hypothetical protein